MMKRLNFIFILCLISFVVASCQQPSQSEQDAKRQEQANIDAEAQAKAEQQKLNEQSVKLEKDLQRRYRFYSAVSAEYQGQIKINGTDYGISHKSQPTIPLYVGDRIRTVEEVQADINNLGLDSAIRFWNIKKPQAATGCQFLNIKAFYENGAYKLQSEACGNIFNIFVGGKMIAPKDLGAIASADIEGSAVRLAQSILVGQVSEVESVIVQMQSTVSGTTQTFQLQRIP
jgi:hypothetical protein